MPKHRHQRLDQVACIDRGRFRLTRIEKIAKLKHCDMFAIENKIPLEGNPAESSNAQCLALSA